MIKQGIYFLTVPLLMGEAFFVPAFLAAQGFDWILAGFGGIGIVLLTCAALVFLIHFDAERDLRKYRRFYGLPSSQRAS